MYYTGQPIIAHFKPALLKGVPFFKRGQLTGLFRKWQNLRLVHIYKLHSLTSSLLKRKFSPNSVCSSINFDIACHIRLSANLCRSFL